MDIPTQIACQIKVANGPKDENTPSVYLYKTKCPEILYPWVVKCLSFLFVAMGLLIKRTVACVPEEENSNGNQLTGSPSSTVNISSVSGKLVHVFYFPFIFDKYGNDP